MLTHLICYWALCSAQTFHVGDGKREIVLPIEEAWSVVFSDDGHSLFIGGGKTTAHGFIRSWDLRKNLERKEAEVKLPTPGFLALSNDGRFLAAVSPSTVMLL